MVASRVPHQGDAIAQEKVRGKEDAKVLCGMEPAKDFVVRRGTPEG